jgi:hypothetical protein
MIIKLLEGVVLLKGKLNGLYCIED